MNQHRPDTSLADAMPQRLGDQGFHRVGILHHPKKPESIQLGQQIAAFLRAHGLEEIWFESAWESEAVLEHLPNVDLLITLGGDGTLLRAARLGARHNVPMLGVKMGRLGFLAEIFPDDWQAPLTRMLQGSYWVEQRLMVRVRLERSPAEGAPRASLCEYDALNDVVLSRGGLARVVRISVQLDGGYLTTYTCDGLIVSTATGSTGYALAVGGPILPPELRNILVIPIAPHLSMDRAVVLSEGTEIRMRAYSDHEAMLTVDGQFVVEVREGDEIMVTGSPHLARFIRMRDRSYFYRTLMNKLRGPSTQEGE
ncbi:NAD(+)/NADH kinase [Litorilinea aerophila]|nr:NAD(+)/NADH kinase [Litorilinea aerophila]MCC9074918.1 NAD(+)/NADH kinase [Litorilinea aerophila]